MGEDTTRRTSPDASAVTTRRRGKIIRPLRRYRSSGVTATTMALIFFVQTTLVFDRCNTTAAQISQSPDRRWLTNVFIQRTTECSWTTKTECNNDEECEWDNETAICLVERYELVPTPEITLEPTTLPTSPPTLEPTAQCSWATKRKCKKYEECAWDDDSEQCSVKPDDTPEPTAPPTTEPTSPPTLEPTAQCSWATKKKCKKYEECVWDDDSEQCFVKPDDTPEPTAPPTAPPTPEPTSPLTLEPTAQCSWATKKKCKKYEECDWDDDLEQCVVRPDETPEPTDPPTAEPTISTPEPTPEVTSEPSPGSTGTPEPTSPSSETDEPTSDNTDTPEPTSPSSVSDEPTPAYTGSNEPTIYVTFPPTVNQCPYKKEFKCVQEGCVWNGKICKSCLSFPRDKGCIKNGCRWSVDLGTCSSCSDHKRELPCRKNDCMWNNEDNVCTSCHIHKKHANCVDAKCVWKGKNIGCVACDELKTMDYCSKKGCKWTMETKTCSANVKPYNREKACIERGGSWDDTARGASRCTKCSTINYFDCKLKPGCVLGRQSGQSYPKCKSCVDIKEAPKCSSHPGCGWNRQTEKCLPCISAKWSKSLCENRYECAWDGTKRKGDIESCISCEKVITMEQCQTAPNCGWRKRGVCVKKPPRILR